MPLRADQLETQRSYIRNNPRNRLLRMCNRQWMHAQRGGIDTALSVEALKGYLRRECKPWEVSDEKLDAIEAVLITNRQKAQEPNTSGQKPQAPNELASCDSAAWIDCDTYGNRELHDRAKHKVLPLVCHRQDASLLDRQKAACFREAEAGAVIVSARISKAEQELFDALQKAGYPCIRIEDNGFPEVYHPSEQRQQLVAEGKLLIVTPWRYHYRHQDENITVAYCKTMNCVVQALCRTRDDWWK